MKLAIERSGGFDIIESADVERIEVENHGVRIYMTDGTDVFAEREGHAESVATAAAIAAKCGTLVEALAEAPEVDGEDDVGEAMAVATRPSTTVRRVTPVSEWTRGEPPRDGMTYVAREGVNSLCVRWDGERWRMGMLVVELGAGVAHLPMPIPPR